MTARLKIVIADDEEDIRQGFRRLLHLLDCDVVGEAADGVELIKVCRMTRPELVITDIRMPQMSGIEAARKIAESSSIPVIVVSSYECPLAEDCTSIVDFLLKPVSLVELQRAISRACPSV